MAAGSTLSESLQAFFSKMVRRAALGSTARRGNLEEGSGEYIRTRGASLRLEELLGTIMSWKLRHDLGAAA